MNPLECHTFISSRDRATGDWKVNEDSRGAMYWPLGAPKAYSLSKHATAPATTLYSDGGVATPGATAVTTRSGLGGAADEETGTLKESTQRNGTSTNGGDLPNGSSNEFLSAKLARSGDIFATITRSTLTVWQAKPTVALAAVVRSAQSMKAYGANCALLVQPAALVIVVQTVLGYLITYSLVTDPQALVYRLQLPESHGNGGGNGTYRRASSASLADVGTGESEGIREVTLRFRMVIRIDAGISTAIALDDELVVATRKPAALQRIRWVAEEGTPQTSTELVSSMPWYSSADAIVEMVHDRPMNLTCWISGDGKAYVVQRRSRVSSGSNSKDVFRGFCFRQPERASDAAVKVAINARFSLIAVGCADGRVDVYTVKDYSGNVPFSHKHQAQATLASTGRLTHLDYSPDGYCLFVGYERGWSMLSVYGKALSSSFIADRSLSVAKDERWLHGGVREAFWLGGGCELAILPQHDDRVWILEVLRSAATGCLAASENLTRGLLQGSTTVSYYIGHQTPDVTSLPSDVSLWQTIQLPPVYLSTQWPIKSAVISPESKYIAIAGRRGLAHYSIASNRWKTFADDPAAEQAFAVRGGMCWYLHYLIAAIETENSTGPGGKKFSVRVYSREKALQHRSAVWEEAVDAPVILLTMSRGSGGDSLLVYTYDNVLLHYIVAPSTSNNNPVKLVQVGQIGFHGIIRAPPRVRALSWILPDQQVESGDPARDVATATVVFLVDGKLVVLQPGTNEEGDLKYDMRVVAQGVEYYLLLRDQPEERGPNVTGEKNNTDDSPPLNGATSDHSLRDSLWYFDGDSYNIWPDLQDVLASAPSELGRELSPPVRIPLDFYPLSPSPTTGLAHGLDTELTQRRDFPLAFYRPPQTRTQLFLAPLLRHYLDSYNSPAAQHLAASYTQLPYFAHALEVLLHDVLDAEVDRPPSGTETALLPTVVSFLSSFPAYLDIIVNCTRKTELRSWKTLFACLPPVQELFEESLGEGKLKTAAGYLLVLHAMVVEEEEEEEGFRIRDFGRLLGLAVAEGDWELCGELARFLVGVDGGGGTLRKVLAEAGFGDDDGRAGVADEVNGAALFDRSGMQPPTGSPAQRTGRKPEQTASEHTTDYFSRGSDG
ncbi:WD40 repeat protein [Friedmanniomyces endolithicus]|nr:WD40 repeat protein [Friedmanniomyces endolithicus]KAK0801210.1 WD40 repeat protein [Friedmanniomyces endolithicus]KAK0809126.1 WD40 repeat protein [Friedmanniomyces endolithicus]KAK0904028.1 WD40 repeat protein [Friedmanniomyces endolithicus]